MQVKTNVFRLLDPQVVQLGNSVVAGATGKAELANSPLTVAQLQTLVTGATAAISAETLANDAAALKLTARLEAVEALRLGINRFAVHADAVYSGNKMSLQSIGLSVRNPAVPVGPIPAPQYLRARPGAMEGSVDLDWVRSPVGRPQYFAEFAASLTGPWKSFYTGRAARTTCFNLTPGAEFFFRVKANGQAGDSPWSDITAKRAS